MIKYNIYYEQFSLLNLFKKKIQQEVRGNPQQEAQKARACFAKMKTLLNSRGYTIVRDPYGDNWHCRKDRKIGLSNPSERERKHIDSKFLQVLFTMAHEVGHSLQYDDKTEDHFNMNTRIKEYEDLVTNYGEKPMRWKRIEDINPKQWDRLKELYKFELELNAWIQGLQFIPHQYHMIYKKYAKRYYVSYMNRIVKKNLSRFKLELKMLDYFTL